MTAARAARPDPDIGEAVVEGDDAETLERIRDGAVDLALWRRTLPAALSGWLATASRRCLPTLRAVAAPADLPDLLKGALRAAEPAPARLLAADLHMLVARFGDIAGQERVAIRLDIVAGDACWKFHRDRVPLRLLTTYVGPGTQYVHPADADRALHAQRAFDGPVARMPTQAVGIFRGVGAAPGTGRARGVVHRSPPVAGTGLVRLVLCLDLPPPDLPARASRIARAIAPPIP